VAGLGEAAALGEEEFPADSESDGADKADCVAGLGEAAAALGGKEVPEADEADEGDRVEELDREVEPMD